MNNKLNVLAYFMFAIALVLGPIHSNALEREFELEAPAKGFPTIKVKESNDRKSWSVYGSSGADFVILLNLGMQEARYLLSMSEKALKSYQEIIDIGRCPKGEVKSGVLGKITQLGDTMDFEVVCADNNIILRITMRDEYVVNFLIFGVEAADLKTMATDLISALENGG